MVINIVLISMGSPFADHSLVPRGVNASFRAAKRFSATTNGSQTQTLPLALLLLQHHGDDSNFEGYRGSQCPGLLMEYLCILSIPLFPRQSCHSLSQLQAMAEKGQLHSWDSGARIGTASVKRPDQKEEL